MNTYDEGYESLGRNTTSHAGAGNPLVIPVASQEPGCAQGSVMLHGLPFLLLLDIYPSSALPTTFESIIPVIAVAVTALVLAWNLFLRKRLARYKHYSASESERYRQFFESCPDALFVLEHEGSIASANSCACKLLKMDRQNLLANTFLSFINQVSLIEFRKQFRNCFSGTPIHCQVDLQTGEGSVIPVEVNGIPQIIKGKNFVQLYVRDKSVLRETEEQVRSLYDQLEEVTAELEEQKRKLQEQPRLVREELIAIINHRIRTPLDGIMGMGQILSDTPLNIEQFNCVNTILNSSTNLLNVITALSENPEDASGELELQKELVDLRAICDRLSIRYGALAVRKGIELRCDCQSNVPKHVVTDGRQLNQVLSNLLDNAIKFTAKGLVLLNIECRRKSSEEAEIYFQVIDTGLGVDEESRSDFFESSLHTGDDEYERGLGLAASRQVVEKLGGTIGQTGTKGKGSTFYFDLTLPLELSQPEVRVDEQPHAVEASSEASIKNSRVLVVDDNKICQKVVAAMLHKAGCRVELANNGKEALLQMQKKDFDLVLMDCQMPVMDGHQATVCIRSMSEPYRSVPIIALTAHSLKHELKICLDSGMDDCLVKPVDRQKLIATVSGYIKEGRAGTVMVRAS